MSHHLDTPLARQNGQLYIDDLFVFDGDHSTVFIMDVNSTVTGPDVQPGFHPEARYEFKVHVDGADFETLTYRASFGEPDSAGRQALQLHSLSGDQAREDSATGVLVLEGRTGETSRKDGVRIWAGRIGDPFYSTWTSSGSSTPQSRTARRRICQPGGRRERATALPTRPSSPSCWRSRISTRYCTRERGPASGVPPSSRPTPAAGGRSTGLAIP